MTMLTRRGVGASVFAALFASSSAAAQAPQTVRVRGTIEKVDGQTLTVKLRDGNTLTIKPADNARVTAMIKASLADIKVGDFVGVTAMPQPDGSQKADWAPHLYGRATRCRADAVFAVGSRARQHDDQCRR